MGLYNEFFLACLIMGLGIGIDVAIATFMQASVLSNKKMVIIWVAGVSLTHTLFPMIGYLLTYFSVQQLPIVTPLVGLLAFALITKFLMGEIKSLLQHEDSKLSSFISVALILAVSWDALWSGPAKSAQVMGWADWMIFLSFLLVGTVVTCFCLISLYLSKKICGIKSLFNKSNKNRFLDVCRWVQYSVINYFGMLALLRYSFNSDINWVYILLISFMLMWLVLKSVNNRTARQHKVFS